MEALNLESTAMLCPKSKKPLQVYFEKVTPKLAGQWLDTNHHNNRKIKPRSINTYSAAMRKGLWQPSASQITLSETGKLVDGQHRLHAVIAYGKPVWMMIISGVPEDAITAIDNGTGRTLSDALMIDGKDMPAINSVAGSLRMMWILHNSANEKCRFKTSYSARPSNIELIAFLEKLPKYRESCAKFMSTFKYSKLFRRLPAGPALAMYYCMNHVDEDITFALMKSFESGIPFDGRQMASPMFHLISARQRQKDLKQSVKPFDHVNGFMWAFVKTANGVDVAKMPAPMKNFVETEMPAFVDYRKFLRSI